MRLLSRRFFFSPLGVACCIALLPFVVTWGTAHIFYDFDMTFITVPIEDMFAHYERMGQLPLWAPEIQGGFPLIAISHLGFFYPLHFLLRLFLPGVITLNISLALHCILMTVGTYLFVRKQGFSKEASALGAITMTGTGFFVGRIYLTNVLLPLTWVPLSLWLLHRWLEERRLQFLFGLSVTMALQILLGQPQAALLGVITLAVYAIAYTSRHPLRRFLWLLPLIAAAALTLLLAYAQIHPTLDLVPNSDRADAISDSELLEFSFPAFHIVSWVLPQAFGYRDTYFGAKNETELSSWFGVTLLLLAGYGLSSLFSLKKKETAFFILALLFLTVLLATGKASPLYVYLVHQHWITSFSIPSRFIFLLMPAMALLAAHGFDTIRIHSQKTRVLRLAFCSIALVFLLVIAWIKLPALLLPRVEEQLFQAPIKLLPPLLAGIALWVCVLHKRFFTFPAIVAIVALELFIPNMARNIRVPFSYPFYTSSLFSALSQDPAGPRLFTQRDLSLIPSTHIRTIALKKLDASFSIEQSFRSTGDELHGIRLQVQPAQKSAPETPFTVTVEDTQTHLTRILHTTDHRAEKDRSLSLLFPPLTHIQGHTIRVRIETPSKTPETWFFVSHTDTPETQEDILPGGTVEFCTHSGSCTIPSLKQKDIGGPDLALEPLYEPFDRIRLAQELLSPHIGASKGIPSTQWLGALQLHDVKRYTYDMGDQNENASGYNPFLASHRGMFDRFQTGFFLSALDPGRLTGTIPNTTLLSEHLLEGQTVRLYKNNQAHPRVEFAGSVFSVPHPDYTVPVLESSETPLDEVTAEDDTLTQGKTLSKGTARIVSYEPTRVVVETENAGLGFLVLRDTFYPDWQATIDGTPTRIFPTDMIFRGLLVPAGHHTVMFSYHPTATLRAIGVSMASWTILLLGFLGTVLFRYRAHFTKQLHDKE